MTGNQQPNDTKTIALSPDTHADLDDLKTVEGETFESVIQRLIAEYNGESDGMDDSRVRELAREEIRDAVVLEALE